MRWCRLCLRTQQCAGRVKARPLVSADRRMTWNSLYGWGVPEGGREGRRNLLTQTAASQKLFCSMPRGGLTHELTCCALQLNSASPGEECSDDSEPMLFHSGRFIRFSSAVNRGSERRSSYQGCTSSSVNSMLCSSTPFPNQKKASSLSPRPM